MNIRLAQLLVSKNIDENREKIFNTVSTSERNDFVIFPEGMLSGYYPEEPEFLQSLDKEKINMSVKEIKEKVVQKGVSCIFGTAYYDTNWYNSAVFINTNGDIRVYHKNNLSTLDREYFHQGSILNVMAEEKVIFGIQMCRELVFPEQWKVLKKKGAEVVFHINNAIKEKDKKWRHLLFTRAFENQYFVCSINNPASSQALPSFVISPTGEVLFESEMRKEQIIRIEIDIKEVLLTYLKQEREDLVTLQYN